MHTSLRKLKRRILSIQVSSLFSHSPFVLYLFCAHLSLRSRLGGKQDLRQELVSAMPEARAAQCIPGIWQH